MPDYRVKRPASTNNLIIDALKRMLTAYAEVVGTSRVEKVLAAGTPGQRLLLAWYFYYDDVTNGGHAQYFANYTGDLWQDALNACEAFGASEGGILREAVALFPRAKPGSTTREREKQLRKIDPKKLDKLDARFYKSPESDEQVRQYIKAHAKEFFIAAGA